MCLIYILCQWTRGKGFGLFLQIEVSFQKEYSKEHCVTPQPRPWVGKKMYGFWQELGQLPERPCKYLLLFLSFMDFVSNFVEISYPDPCCSKLDLLFLLNLLSNKKWSQIYLKKDWELLFLRISELWNSL